MIIIHTRQSKKGKWWCNGTIKNYDYSFKGKTIKSATIKMVKHLADINITMSETKWNEPQLYF
jgi:hypothetical protein